MGGGGVFWVSHNRTEKTQSAKICLNLNFAAWGRGYSGQARSENTQSAKMPKFQFSGGILGKSELKIFKVPRSA